MRICVLCPDGHPVELDESRLGSIVACPRCFAPFHADADRANADYARAEKGRSRPARDDDDDDDDDEEEVKPVKKKAKAQPVKKKKPVDDDDDEEDEKPHKKKPAPKADDDDDDDDDEEDEDDEEETGPLTKKQQNLQMVQLGMSLIAWGIVFLGCIPLFNLFGGGLMWAGGTALFREMPWLFYILGGMLGICEVAIDILVILGVSFGFWGPRQAELKSTIFGVYLFSGLMIVAIIVGVLGFTNVLTDDPRVGANLGNLFFGLAGLCKIVFLLTTMTYLKKVAYFFKDRVLASMPLNILLEFLVWAIVPPVLLVVIVNTFDVRHLDGLSYIVVGLYDLFLLFATFRANVLLVRWVRCVNQVGDLLARTIKDM